MANKFKKGDIVTFTTKIYNSTYDKNWESTIIGDKYKVDNIGQFDFGKGMMDTISVKGEIPGWIPTTIVNLYRNIPRTEQNIDNNYSIY